MGDAEYSADNLCMTLETWKINLIFVAPLQSTSPLDVENRKTRLMKGYELFSTVQELLGGRA